MNGRHEQVRGVSAKRRNKLPAGGVLGPWSGCGDRFSDAMDEIIAIQTSLSVFRLPYY